MLVVGNVLLPSLRFAEIRIAKFIFASLKVAFGILTVNRRFLLLLCAYELMDLTNILPEIATRVIKYSIVRPAISAIRFTIHFGVELSFTFPSARA